MIADPDRVTIARSAMIAKTATTWTTRMTSPFPLSPGSLTLTWSVTETVASSEAGENARLRLRVSR